MDDEPDFLLSVKTFRAVERRPLGDPLREHDGRRAGIAEAAENGPGGGGYHHAAARWHPVFKLLGKRYPDVKKVSLTAFATEEKRSASLAAGAELFIEKPSSTEGFKSVYAMLKDLMNWAPQQGFQGMLRRVGLQDVIQMECLGRNSSVVEVYNEHVLGRIYIEDGSIIHAAGGELTGERALQRLLALPGGSLTRAV